MNQRNPRKPFAFRPTRAAGAALLLLIVGALTAGYQYHSAHLEKRRQLTVQAKILAASVTAAIAFDDRAAAQENVNALMLDPRLDAAAVDNESHQRVAGFHRAGSAPIADVFANSGRLPDDRLLVKVDARQGSMAVGTVYLRAADTPLIVQLARYSGVLLLTAMAVLMLSALAVAQRALTRANAALQLRAQQLAETNKQLTDEMEHRAHTEEALRQSQKMEAIGQLSGGIAHDFNNLLMIIKGSLTLLQKKLRQQDQAVGHVAALARERLLAGIDQPVEPILPVLAQGLDLFEQRGVRHAKLERHLEVAHGSIERAASLTRRLLTFARGQPLTPKSLNLDALVRSIQQLLKHSVGASARIDYQLNSRWRVLCDSNQMENAILNLVINARDAMPNGGQITISTEDRRIDAEHPHNDLPAGDYVHLRVGDTGMGMSEEVRSKAFDPFFTTKPVGKGTGLGLSQVYGFVRQSGGYVRIYSEVGEGTTLKIYL
ncbi:MAG TPA: ATP-binding protein, partial [Rhodanobacter sp.]|nr:ATP-binding protein [Rhodanobacter sp.]